MHALHASRRRGAWRIRIAPATSEAWVPPGPEDAVRLGRQAVLAWRNELIADSESDAVCAEFPKAVIGEGEIALGFAELVARRCATAGEDGFAVVAPRGWLSRRSVALALRKRGLRVASAFFFDAMSMLVAGIAAWCLLLVHAALHARLAAPKPTGGWWLAVHGEWSNRTRHVLPAATGRNPPSAILVVGRPRSRLSTVAAEWKLRLGAETLPVLIRPWSLPCVLRTLPAACGATAAAMRIATRAPYLPAFRERMGMLYRIHMGLASARWWRRQRWLPGRIVYGHTGNADTTLLELAQHATGQQTWHVVHGVSGGLNFTGRSSVAVFACAHDARWHERLGGYGRCLHLPARMVAPVEGESGLLLLTNYAHPMNVECRVTGTRAEETVLRAVPSAAEQLGVRELRWRPHPALVSLDESEQDALRQVASHLGFRELPPGDDWLEDARSSRWVVTTASTVVIHLLEAGIVPVVLMPGWLDPDCALARHPVAVRDLSLLPDVLRRFDGTAHAHGQVLAEAWQAIGPARPASVMDWME